MGTTASDIVRQALHLWLLHMARELEIEAEQDAKRKDEWAQHRGPKNKRRAQVKPT